MKRDEKFILSLVEGNPSPSTTLLSNKTYKLKGNVPFAPI